DALAGAHRRLAARGLLGDSGMGARACRRARADRARRSAAPLLDLLLLIQGCPAVRAPDRCGVAWHADPAGYGAARVRLPLAGRRLARQPVGADPARSSDRRHARVAGGDRHGRLPSSVASLQSLAATARGGARAGVLEPAATRRRATCRSPRPPRRAVRLLLSERCGLARARRTPSVDRSRARRTAAAARRARS